MTGTPTLTPRTTPFRIEADGLNAKVEIGGVDVTSDWRLHALDFTMGHEGAPDLTLHSWGLPGGVIEGEGNITVVVEPPAETRHTAAAFVRSLDPATISNLVAQRSCMGRSTAGLYLDVIAQMLEASE